MKNRKTPKYIVKSVKVSRCGTNPKPKKPKPTFIPPSQEPATKPIIVSRIKYHLVNANSLNHYHINRHGVVCKQAKSNNKPEKSYVMITKNK